MLVVFLILFTQVLANSEEDKYVDLLPDAEKQQFIEKVARRILKDVQSQENETNVQSGEMSDEQLKKHNDYVKAILKQETEYARRSKGKSIENNEGKPASAEKEFLGVKPLESKKMANVNNSASEQVDLTLRSDRRDIAASDESTTDYIKVEIITDNVPIIKRSVQDNNVNKSFDSDETTSETLSRVLQTKTAISNQVDIVTENSKADAVTNKSENLKNTSEVGVVTKVTNETIVVSTASEEPTLADLTTLASKLIEPKNNSLLKVVPVTETKDMEFNISDWTEETKGTENLEIMGSLPGLDKDDEIELGEGKHSGSGESDSEDGLERVIEGPWSRKSIKDGIKSDEEIMDSDMTTSAVEYFGFKPKENNLDENNNVSSADEEFTTLSYAFESTSIKDTTAGNTTPVITTIDSPTTETTTTDSPTIETTTTDSPTTETTTTDNPTTDNPTTETATTHSLTTETATTVTTITESKTIRTNKDNITEPYIKSWNDTSKNTENELDATKKLTTKSTLTSILTDEGTTEFVPRTTKFVPNSTEFVSGTTESVPGMTTFVPGTTPSTENAPKVETGTITIESTYMPVAMTEDMKIVVEEFTSAPTPATTVKSFTIDPTESSTKKEVSKKEKPNIEMRFFEMQEIKTKTQNSDEASIKPLIKATTKKTPHKLIFHKLEKFIVGPKAHEIKAAEKNNRDKNFIELEKVYYDNNYKVKTGKEYHVYEISADRTPFITDELSMVDQPYYVPIYNYSPNNAYFNPQNRLGPNPGDSSAEKVDSIDDNILKPRDENKEIKDFDMEYFDTPDENKRKKFGNKQKLSHSIHKQPPQQTNQQDKKRGKLNHDDYVDSDYFFGRIRKDMERRVNQEETFYTFPNSDENDHPAHSIQEGNLKDHVRAVRNILFHQKSFGLLDKDKYGREVSELRTIQKRKQNEAKQKEMPKKFHALRSFPNDDSTINNNENKNNNHNKNKDGENNIAIDYYFGSDQPVVRADIKKVGKSGNHIQKVGYLKNQNDTRELYVMDDVFKQNVEKYIQEQKTKGHNRIKNDIRPATPRPASKTKQLQENRHQEIADYREDEKQRIAEIMEQSKSIYKQGLSIDEAKKEVHTESLPQIIQIAEFRNGNDSVTTDVSTVLPKEDNPINPNDNYTLDPSVKGGLNLNLNHRRNDAIKVGVYLQVLTDMISVDNNALKQYDWLGTTVDIQSALQKLFELTGLVANEENVHPADMEILKYVVFIHKLASEIIEANDFGSQLRKKLVLPRNKKSKMNPRTLKEKGLINRVWLYLRREVPDVNENGALKNLNKFLMDIEDGLYELHDAIKHIAKITKYKNQQWYQNLKDLYINTDDKHLLELLLHMTVLRLFVLIEDSAKNGLEDDYIEYMKNNRKVAKKTLEEMIFVIQILEEYNTFLK